MPLSSVTFCNAITPYLSASTNLMALEGGALDKGLKVQSSRVCSAPKCVTLDPSPLGSQFPYLNVWREIIFWGLCGPFKLYKYMILWYSLPPSISARDYWQHRPLPRENSSRPQWEEPGHRQGHFSSPSKASQAGYGMLYRLGAFLLHF